MTFVRQDIEQDFIIPLRCPVPIIAEGSIPNPTKNVSTIATVVTFDHNDHNDHLADFTLLTTTCWIQLSESI